MTELCYYFLIDSKYDVESELSARTSATAPRNQRRNAHSPAADLHPEDGQGYETSSVQNPTARGVKTHEACMFALNVDFVIFSGALQWA